MEPSYPIRINRYLALKGYTTRRKADTLIESGFVRINGKVAVLGDTVNEKDKVDVKNHTPNTNLVYIAYNKPEDVVTHGPQGDEIDIQKSIKRTDVFPLGRLDKKSHGLILLTNDGRVTAPLLNPDSDHEKEYFVTVDKRVTNQFLKHMSRGVNIEGYKTKGAVAKKESEKAFSIILTEGKTHQIRRMCAALGYVVRDLKRVRIMNIKLGSLKKNDQRELRGKELAIFLQELEIAPPPDDLSK